MPDDVIDRDVRARMPRFQRWLWLPWTVLLVVGVVITLVDDDPDKHPLIVIGLSVVAWLLITSTRLPRKVVVDGTGVKLPFKRVIPWSDVASVKQPGPWTGVVTIRLKDGSERYTGLPLSDSEQVARIGGVPLE